MTLNDLERAIHTVAEKISFTEPSTKINLNEDRTIKEGKI